jgi:hypothetical protein
MTIWFQIKELKNAPSGTITHDSSARYRPSLFLLCAVQLKELWARHEQQEAQRGAASAEPAEQEALRSIADLDRTSSLGQSTAGPDLTNGPALKGAASAARHVVRAAGGDTTGGCSAAGKPPPQPAGHLTEAEAQERMCRHLNNLVARGVLSTESNATRARTACCAGVWHAARQSAVAAMPALGSAKPGAHTALAEADMAEGALPHMQALASALVAVVQNADAGRVKSAAAARRRSKASHAAAKVRALHACSSDGIAFCRFWFTVHFCLILGTVARVQPFQPHQPHEREQHRPSLYLCNPPPPPTSSAAQWIAHVSNPTYCF